MGSSEINNSLLPYGQAEHPIQGQVTAFKLKDEAGKFVMKFPMSLTKEQLTLYQRVQSAKNPKLLTFYGIQQSDKTSINTAGEKKNGSNLQILSGQIEIPVYWQYFNWDLQQQVKYHQQKQQLIKEDMLWEVFENCLVACEYLATLNLYPELSPKTLQFTAGSEPKLYWCDLQPKNMHRAYERFNQLGQFRHTIYAPQELLQINRTTKSLLESEKCVVFSIGMLLLEACTLANVKGLYNYQRREFSEAKKRELLTKMEGKYSKELETVLGKMLEYFPKDRLDYKQVRNKIEVHKNPVLVETVLSNEQKTEVKEENVEVKSKDCWPNV